MPFKINYYSKTLRFSAFFFIIASYLMSLTGCANFYGSKFQNVSFDSEPPEAMLYFNGKFIGKTPIMIVTPIKRSRKEIKEYRKKLMNGSITDDEFDDYKNSIHNIIVTKEGVGTRQIYISPKAYSKHSPNRNLCIFDNVYSPLTLFSNIFINYLTRSCVGFDKKYKIILSQNVGGLYRNKSSISK